MLIKIIRLLTIVLVGFGMGPAIGHLLEMPAKMAYDGTMWLTLLQTLYPPAFGPVGGVVEAAAVLVSLVLVFLVRHRRLAFIWTLLGAICMMMAHAAFWIWVKPVNAMMLNLTPRYLALQLDPFARPMRIHPRNQGCPPAYGTWIIYLLTSCRNTETYFK